METMNCPSCGYRHEPTGTQDDHGETNCEVCGFAFTVEIETEPTYVTFCVEHKWGPTKTSPGAKWSYRNCTLCTATEVINPT